MDEATKQFVQRRSPLGFVTVERVGEAFEQAVTRPVSGSLLVVMPGTVISEFTLGSKHRDFLSCLPKLQKGLDNS